MDVSPHIIVLIFAVVVFVGFWLLRLYYADKRLAELYRWAISRGLSFDAAKDFSMKDRYPDFACLREGSSRYAYNIMRGTKNNRSICAFDYHYETESIDSEGNTQTDNHYFSAVMVETGMPLEPLLIRHETFFDKIGEFFGGGDIHFESAEFNRQFHVASPNRRWAFDALPQPTMEFLLESPRFVLEIQNGCVLAYRNNTFTTDGFDAALAVVFGFLDRIPKSVLSDLKGTT